MLFFNYIFAAMNICGFNIKIGVSLAALIKEDIILTSDTELALKLFLDRKYLISIDVQNKTIFICLKKDAQPYDVLEAYFHACLCGLFICMSLKVPLVSKLYKWILMLIFWSITFFQDVFVKPEVSDLSYPLMRLYVLNKRYSNTNNRIQSSKAIESIYATNLLISGEYKAFISDLESKGK